MWHDSFADVTSSLLEDPHNLGRSSRVPAGVDDDGAAELCLSLGRGPQHPGLALCDWPAGANLPNHAATDICAIGAVQHLPDNDVRELKSGKQGIHLWQELINTLLELSLVVYDSRLNLCQVTKVFKDLILDLGQRSTISTILWTKQLFEKTADK